MTSSRVCGLCGSLTFHVVAVNLFLPPPAPSPLAETDSAWCGSFSFKVYCFSPLTSHSKGKAMCLCWDPVEELGVEQGRPRK